MPHPVSICLEDLDSGRFLRCVLLPGNQPGLGLDARGSLLWKEEGSAAELWVTADQRLALLRPEGAPAVEVHRGPRSVQAPCEKPVILLAGDEVHLGDRRLRLHVHGRAYKEHAPEPLPVQRSSHLRLATAALALGLAGCITVRPAPPKPSPPDWHQEELAAERSGVLVTVQVVDDQGEPVDGASLVIDGQRFEVDGQGRYSFRALRSPQGSLRPNTPGLVIDVVAEAVGFLPFQGEITVLEGDTEVSVGMVRETTEVEVRIEPPEPPPPEPPLPPVEDLR